MVIRWLKKYYILAAAIACTLLFIGHYSQTHSENYQGSVDTFTSSFHAMERRLENMLGFHSENILNDGIDKEWLKLEQEEEIRIHVYEGDSLIFWNTNQLPIIRFADIHFPTEGILHLQNGWYYAKIVQEDDYLICGSFLIQQDYAYENNELINEFTEPFSVPFKASISLEEEKGYSVKDVNGEYLLSLIPADDQEPGRFDSVLIILLLLGSIVLWLLWLSRAKRRFPPIVGWSIPAVVVGLRLLSLHYEWFGFLSNVEAFDPRLYGTNRWFPNFGEFLINVSVMIYLMGEVNYRLKRIKNGTIGKGMVIGILVLSIVLWPLLLYLNRGLIVDSSIPLIIDELFSLNIYSILAMTGIGVYFHAYYLLVRVAFVRCQDMDVKASRLAVVLFIAGVIFLMYEINYGYRLLFAGLFPLILYGLIFFLVFRRKNVLQLGAGLILLSLFSIVTAINNTEFNRRKERGERELYANQLATEKNIGTEAEYVALKEKIAEDNFLKKFISNPQFITTSDFQEGMERRLFKGYWERYEMGFSLFNSNHELMIEDRKDNEGRYQELENIVKNSGVPSELDRNIFFIEDYTGQYSYIIRQEIVGRDSLDSATLFCTLKSKKVPEEIGFPRLLISSKTNVLEPLERYSIAKFHRGRLITNYGGFNYPSTHKAMVPKGMERGFFDYGGFNHYMLRRSNSDVVVLSIRNNTYVDLITSFSYLFSFYGLMLFPLMFRMNYGGRFRRTLSLAMKIQIVLISLVFLSLLAFGWGSGIFVSNQYNQYTNDVIREKLNSVQTEVRAKLGHFEQLSIYENGNYMEYILKKFAKVFFTDINLYDNNGYLLATSRPKVFNIGLLSEQMNPIAFKHMKFRQKSEFVHNESIGKLNYSSAYLPFYNNNDERMGFINLQHFGQQREFENQIQRFLVAIINVFILLLAISIVLAIFISNWLTSPLRILQESFAGVKFGKHNEQISYDKEDEIGALVKDYNQKLEELEFAAQQLAKSERESAWREMAKQVAHEIKNPLTPMKLSVQQLLRTYNPDDPKSGEKLNKVANSIIEQIEALTKIANEFSTFAKMPNPTEEKLDVVALVKGVREVFDMDARVNISIVSDQREMMIMADKNQFVRVFNNLIKNAIQAIQADKEGVITIHLKQKDNKALIRVSDNGVGIAPSKIGKIFVPYFTTKSTGTGLGLAMVKQIIEIHKGQIDFVTKEGEGTTFEIILPLAD